MVLEQTGKSKQDAVVVTRMDQVEQWDDAAEMNTQEAVGWVQDLKVTSKASTDTTAPSGSAAQLASIQKNRQAVYAVSYDISLGGGKRGLKVFQKNTLIKQVGWDSISEIIVVGRRRMSSAVYEYALRKKVPIVHYSRNHKLLGMTLPANVHTPSETSYKQWQWTQESENCLIAAKSLVSAKVHNQRMLVRHQTGDVDDTRIKLKEISQAVKRATSLERLRGLEGQAARVYFQKWDDWVKPHFSFERRTGRGASDPINALCNLVYTQLFRSCWLSLVSVGLDPFLGVMHQGKGRYAALAADVQEPFRFLCDRTIFRLVHREQIAPGDFIFREKYQPGCVLKEDALKRVLGAWESSLADQVKVGNRKRSYREHIFYQAQYLASFIRGESPDFQAFQLKW
jgi:CRISP-associated protein Cas1